MTQTVIVTKILAHGIVEVSIERPSACGHDCKSCMGCGAPAEVIRVEVKNTVGAKLGDQVVIESSSQQVLGIASFTYLVPIALLFVGFVVTPVYKDFGAAVGFCVGVGFVIVLNRIITNRREPLYRIVNICTK